jgi:hypothetical protein
MKTTNNKKQYVKPTSKVFEMNARVNLLTASNGDPDIFDTWGDGQL